jgi:hypothetical protein
MCCFFVPLCGCCEYILPQVIMPAVVVRETQRGLKKKKNVLMNEVVGM